MNWAIKRANVREMEKIVSDIQKKVARLPGLPGQRA
jgi:hypothetical protein